MTRQDGGRTTAVVKVGTSSVTDDSGALDRSSIGRLCEQVAGLSADGTDLVLVTSGAIAAGLPILGMSPDERPADARTLQAVSAVGQNALMSTYADALAEAGGVPAGQVLLAPLDFMVRRQYLHARATLGRLLELGVVPVVNENDVIADDEIRFGDNDRIAALVAQLIDADVLVLLTDTDGLWTADPRHDAGASLIGDVVEVDAQLEKMAGGSGSNRGSGGMASKLAAAKIASWSGIRTVIASADRPGVVGDAIAGAADVGTTVRPNTKVIGARKVWIAFAVGSSGKLHVDAGAEAALVEREGSLLAPGVSAVEGTFVVDDAVEVVNPSGEVIAKGLVRMASASIQGASGIVIHRDDLVVVG